MTKLLFYRIEQCFWRFNMLRVHKGTSKWQILNFPETQKKCPGSFYYPLLIVFELVALNAYFYREIILVIGSQYVNKHYQDFRCYSPKIFRTEVLSEWSKNLTKLLLCRIEQCFRPFNMLRVHKCSENWLFRHLSNHAFCTL